MNRNLWLLAVCQGLFLTNNVTFIAINGLVGLSLAPLGWMATLPVMGYVVGGALSTGLVALTQRRFGRKASFQLGLGVASIQPLMTERSVLRLKGERADKKLAHWRGIAAATSEQCGRNRVPVIHDVMSLSDWLRSTSNSTHAGSSSANTASGTRMLLSLQDGTRPLAEVVKDLNHLTPLSFLSGPEGGLSLVEEASAITLGFTPVTLGPRVLRSETAPLACLAFLALMSGI